MTDYPVTADLIVLRAMAVNRQPLCGRPAGSAFRFTPRETGSLRQRWRRQTRIAPAGRPPRLEWGRRPAVPGLDLRQPVPLSGLPFPFFTADPAEPDRALYVFRLDQPGVEEYYK